MSRPGAKPALSRARAVSSGLVRWICVLAATLSVAASGCSNDSKETVRSSEGDCQTTKPNGSTPPGEAASSGHHGNGSLWTVLSSDGTIDGRAAGDVLPDGSVRIKFPWWRTARGALEISGYSSSAEGSIRAHIPDGYGDSGFQASAITFPRPGCWTVRARAGSARLTFTVLIAA